MFKDAIDTAKTIKDAWDKSKQLESNLNHLIQLNETSAKTLEIAQMTIELQQLVMSLQLDLRALQLNHRDLEDKIRQYEKFEVEKDQYSPFQFSTGAFVYRSNNSFTNANGEPVFHYLCANCYNQGKKSILQPSQIEGQFECHHCLAKIQSKRKKASIMVID